MAEPEGGSPNNSGWPPGEAPLRPPNLHETSAQQHSHRFQALKDWNWFQSVSTSPWGSSPMCPVRSYGGTGYVPHHSAGRFHAAACTGLDMFIVHGELCRWPSHYTLISRQIKTLRYHSIVLKSLLEQSQCNRGATFCLF